MSQRQDPADDKSSIVPDGWSELKIERVQPSGPQGAVEISEYSINWRGERCTLLLSDTAATFQITGVEPLCLSFPSIDHVEEASIRGPGGRYEGSLKAHGDGRVVFEMHPADPNITVYAIIDPLSGSSSIEAFPDPERRSQITKESLQEAARQFRIIKR